MHLNSSFLSVKLSALSHNNYPTHTLITDTAQLDTIDRVETIYLILLSTKGTCVCLLCSLVSIYYHSIAQKSRKIFIFLFVKLYKDGGGVLGILTNCIIQISRPWKQLSQNQFFQTLSEPIFSKLTIHPPGYSFGIFKFDNQSINMI